MRCGLRAISLAAALAVVLTCGVSGAAEGISRAKSQTPPGEPVLEDATLHSLGAWWIVPADAQGKSRVEMAYRKVGDADWKPGMPMLAVRPGDTTQVTHVAELNPPDDARLFAGSVVKLAADTEYEMRLRLVRPDGAVTEKVLRARTKAEPVDPPNARVCHVVPGKGGGDGSAEKPYLGLDYAQSEARPGTIFLVHKGVYEGTFHVTRSGSPGQPVTWRGAGDGEALIDGGGTGKCGIEISRVHDVRIEKLSIRGFYLAVVIRGSSNLAIRRCTVSEVKCGIYGVPEGEQGRLRNILISDNVLDGPFTWGQGRIGAGSEEWRCIQISGTGLDICYNLIRNFKDGVDTFPAKYCSAIDIHHNDILNCKDDGIELDFSERNARCFENRLTNVHQGISEQPVYGGPAYIFRNVLYNVGVEPFKLHHNGGPTHPVDWWPSGAIMFHNTIVKNGDPCILWSSGPVYNITYRNNLFIGGGKRAFSFDPAMVDCDFDYDGFGGGPWDLFMKWNNVRYKTIDEVRAKAPIERHSVLVDEATAFADGTRRPTDGNTRYDPEKIDLRLKAGCAAVDAGQVLPGFNDDFKGEAPDLGACELGAERPHYGPRPEKK